MIESMNRINDKKNRFTFQGSTIVFIYKENSDSNIGGLLNEISFSLSLA
jgi:hypothetical protein